MLDVKKLLTKICDALKIDYLTTQTTSGNWRYRIWKSGHFEAWWSGNVTLAITTSSGGVYFSSGQTTALPSIGVQSIYFAACTYAGNEGNWGKINSESTTAIGWGLVSSSSRASASRLVQLYVRGYCNS